MKRIGILSGLALAALALTNCSTKEIEVPAEVAAGKEGVPFEIIALPSVETRTVAGEGLTTTWDATNDKLSVFHRTANTGSFTNDGEFRVANAETGTFSGTITENIPAAGNSYDWVAIYPSDANLTSFAPTNRYYYIGCRSDKAQSQNGTGSNAHLAGYKSDNTGNFPLWGKAENVAYNASANGVESPAISMNQVASVLAFNITNSLDEAISVSSIEFTATEDIVGAYYIDFTGTTPAFSHYETYQSATAKLEVTNGTIAAGETGVFYMGIKPFTVEGTAAEPKTLSMKVTTELGDTQVKTFNVAKTMTFSPNKFKNVNMEWTTEHVDLGTTYYQITSADDITADGKYMIVMPDISVTPNEYLVVTANKGSSALHDRLKKGFSVDENGLLSYDSPDASYVWGVYSIVNGGVNFRYENGTTWRGISPASSGTNVATDAAANGYWTPTPLASGCFMLINSNNRFLSRGTTDVIKQYLTSDTKKYQVQDVLPIAQYACEWAILKLGAAPVSTPKIDNVVVNDLSPRSSASNTVTVTKKNTESAIKVLSVDNTVVTAASISGNTVTYTVSNNLTSSARVGTITLALVDDETVTGTVTVNQLGSEFHLPNDATEATKQVNAAANSQTTINVTSDFDWTIDASNLVDATATPASFTYPGSGSNPKTQTVTIKATMANTSSSIKDLGSFKIIRTADNAELTVTVTQKDAKLAAPTISDVSWSNKASLLAGATWSSVTNASSYAYKVDKGDDTAFIAETAASSNSATFTIAAGTLYKLYVKAIGDGTNWFDSDWSAAYSFNLSAETESDFTWDLTTNSYSSATTQLVTWNNPYVTMTLSKGNSQQNANSYLGGSNSQTRFYTGQVVTLTPSTGVSITRVEFTCSSASYAAIQQDWTNAQASISGTVVTVIPSNGSNEISVTVSAATRVTGVKVYYTGSGSSTPETVATPTFNPNGGTFTSAQSVTISCATSGATIHYTTDGSTPTASSTSYSGAITVSTTTTIKAIAVKDDTSSEVASATFTINNAGVVFSTSDFAGQGTSGSGSSISSTKSDITVSSDKAYADGTSHVRVYSGGKIIVSCASGTIKKIEITSTASGTSNNGPSKISTTEGSYSYSGSVGTWTGSASSVTFNASAQFRFTSITVTL